MQSEDYLRLYRRDGDPAGGDGREHRRLAITGCCRSNGQGVNDAFNDYDVGVAVQGVLGRSVERGRLAECRCPCRVAVLGRPGITGGVPADEPVHTPRMAHHREDEPAAVGVDQVAVARRLGEVEFQQFVVGDALTLQMLDQGAPVVPGVADDRFASLGHTQRRDVNAARIA